MSEKEAKFEVGDTVSAKEHGEGTVEEVCPTFAGGFQYRVRIDMADVWVPEGDLTRKKKAPAAAPKVDETKGA